MFSRELAETLPRYAKFPVIAILGPRQSGKTTLAQSVFPKHTFLSLDNEVTQAFALEDPEGFLLTHENEHGLILDEFQYAPKLTTYIKLEADKKKRPGYFILTGSQNFLVNKSITESLAGRVGILNLLPLSNVELLDNKLVSESASEAIFHGGYPRIYADKISPTEFYPSYILSYIQRDVGQLINAKNMTTFRRFVQLCAGRIGQLCNVNALAAETGISAPTAHEWLSILEASYIIFFLEPHFQNFNKRLVKSRKLYFFDTGLACSLLRIDSAETLSLSHFQGALFESFIIADLYKQYCNSGARPSLYFWRDSGAAHEIDCILDQGAKSYPVEIKSGKSIASDSFRGIDYWNDIAKANTRDSYLIYAGSEKQLRKQGTVLGWQDASSLIKNIVTKKEV
ncbi:MAG: ATP-binding protein [Candidatus Babeliales bacterium]